MIPERAKSCQKHGKATAVGGFFGMSELSKREMYNGLCIFRKNAKKWLWFSLFGLVCFEPIRAASALGEQRYAHAVGAFHFFDHKSANGVEFAVGNGEIEFVVHL